MAKLSESFKNSIKAIGGSDLEELYQQFCEETGSKDAEEFAISLFKAGRITSAELKRIETQDKIELATVASLSIGESGDAKLAEGETPSTKRGYTILEPIDEGAMGQILIAKDNELGRTVAFKQIHQHMAGVPAVMDRFFIEAQVTAQLQHPNIVPIYEMIDNKGNVGYAMKLIEGDTLKDLVIEKQKQLDKTGKVSDELKLPALLDHFLKVCDAMHYAHRKGVIHRDLKPQNIMVGSFNEVYVMDWGIAKLVAVDQETFEDVTERVGPASNNDNLPDETRVGQILGTPAYMSPEQARGMNDTLDHRSDLFSLGLILYELVTLKKALAADPDYLVMEKARNGDLNPPLPYSPRLNVPKQLVAIIKKATRFYPEERYETVEDFANDIRRYLHGAAIKAKPDSVGQKLMRWMVRHRLVTLNVMAYTLLAVVSLVGWSLYQTQQGKMEAQLQEQKISDLITTVTNKTQLIDSQFLKFEAILEGLASGATNLITQGKPDSDPYYTHLDYNDPATAPPDYKYSDIYKIPISVDWPVYKLAPGVELSDVEPLIKTINPLRHSFKRLILKSYDDYIAPEDSAGAHNIIMNVGLPLAWAYVGVKEGFIIDYPGKTGYPDEYDPRQRPWYKQTLETNATAWVKPYIDVSGRGWMLPCTTPLYDKNGKFLGVAVVEMTLDYIRNNYLHISDAPGIEKTFLLNEDGHIVVSSTDNMETYETGTLINTIRDLPIYPRPQIVTAIKNQKSGYYRYIDNNEPKILAYYRLNSIGWYYLAEADARQILQ